MQNLVDKMNKFGEEAFKKRCVLSRTKVNTLGVNKGFWGFSCSLDGNIYIIGRISGGNVKLYNNLPRKLFKSDKRYNMYLNGEYGEVISHD